MDLLLSVDSDPDPHPDNGSDFDPIIYNFYICYVSLVKFYYLFCRKVWIR